MAVDYVNILNTIRANATQLYQDRVPVATKDNLSAVGNPILSYEAVSNEFLSSLVNRIIMQMVITKRYNNPLAKFKGNELPYGYSQINTYTNPTKAEAFSESIGESLLKKTLPDTKTEFFNMNRQDMYPVTISEESLSLAFTNGNELTDFISSVFNAMYSGDSIDEYLMMKNLFVSALASDKIVNHVVDDPILSPQNAKNFGKTLKTFGGLFKFASSNYNKYSKIKGGTETEIITWTEPEDLLLILPTDILTELDFESLAVAFNMDKVKFLGQIIEVDNFGDSGIVGVVCDRHVIKVNDHKFKMKEFENGKGLYWNYFLHHWQTLSLSLMSNCVAFTVAP